MLDEELLHSRLVETGLVSRLVRIPSTGSTNAELEQAANAADFAQRWPHMSVITAEEQTSGRGRMGRNWQSPVGSTLSSSILLRPTLPTYQWHWLSLAAGSALVAALRGYGLSAGLKWPNDVHISDRKIAGILASVPPGDPTAVIVGCGINVLQASEQLPTETSTSLVLELGRSAADLRGGIPADSSGQAAQRLRTELLADWLEAFAHLMRPLQREADISTLRSRLIDDISTPGRGVRVELPGGTAVRGTALAVDEQGALQVEVTARRSAVLDAEAGGGHEGLWASVDPVHETFSAGDVVHLRNSHR